MQDSKVLAGIGNGNMVAGGEQEAPQVRRLGNGTTTTAAITLWEKVFGPTEATSLAQLAQDFIDEAKRNGAYLASAWLCCVTTCRMLY